MTNIEKLVIEKGGFIRETRPEGGAGPVLEAAAKALLNRKGNVLFNDGNIEAARRIYVTTNYSDGLSRVGDYYKKKGRVLDALNMYKAAHNKKKYDAVILDMAMLIKSLV